MRPQPAENLRALSSHDPVIGDPREPADTVENDCCLCAAADLQEAK